ncbi:MAG TPA: hypothetical protein VJO52_09215 [Gemmatimonadaceae bacterium]|nr:hypothetical protein [Gemmatimonadaceae bacterium]
MSKFARGFRRLTSPIALAATIALLSACASTTPIGHLLDDPGRYDGKSVRIQGVVKGSAGAFGVGTYQVRDNTGTLTVVSENNGAPREGDKIDVQGIFQALFTLGAQSLAVLREQSRSFP